MQTEMVSAKEGKKFVLTAYGLQTTERGSKICREWFNGHNDIAFVYPKWISKGWVKEVAR